MKGYGPSFAQVYNLRWGRFAQQLAPRLRFFYESTPTGHSNHNLLDICCGTGQFAQHFLDNNYRVTGLDLSPAMLDYARQNTAPYILTGQASFVQADAANFSLDEQFGLAVSTFDALNHLPDYVSLKGCFYSVYPLLIPGGIFIFDLNTLAGLRGWTGVSVEDTSEMMLVTRSIYDAERRKAITHISGFFPAEDSARGDTSPVLYQRFEETAYETAFTMHEVEEALRETGFDSVRFTRSQDFHTSVDDPEQESRIFIIASKACE